MIQLDMAWFDQVFWKIQDSENWTDLIESKPK